MLTMRTESALGNMGEHPACNRLLSVGEAFLSGVLLEAGTHPKPGLVTPRSNGAHNDMTHMTFMVGSAAISQAFYCCADAGFTHTADFPTLLPTLRTIGKSFEKHLLNKTKNVNTQRGALFLGGLLSGVSGKLFQTTESSTLSHLDVCAGLSTMCEGLVERELSSLEENVERKETAGEQLYKRYGARGVRGEVEDGLPSIINAGMPALVNALDNGLSLNDAFAHTLISLLTMVEDTTILWRRGPDFLKSAQQAAQSALSQGGMLTEAGRNTVRQMDMKFSADNFSPGGCADLLAMTIALYLLEKGNFPRKIM
ncbi:triphosphoribosyl-dephospho-CoA synthase [Microvirga sp. W0021]|uniref:triphosphoribosyl-dephospho-CoA synthase n=1 Tax=Hohaiivirga grylli TaxID=3133970 RepID=A0ABV0BMV8_9HYPH